MHEAPPSTDARRIRSRDKLLRAMLNLLEQGPFEEITVRSIAAAAGVGYATFFRHYASKDALLDDLAADAIAGLLGEVMPVFAAEDTRRACVALCEYVARRRHLWRALLTGGAGPLLRALFVAEARGIAAAWPTPTVGASPLDLRVSFAASSTLEVLAWWLGQVEPAAPEVIAGALDRLVIRPTLAEGSAPAG